MDGIISNKQKIHFVIAFYTHKKATPLQKKKTRITETKNKNYFLK